MSENSALPISIKRGFWSRIFFGALELINDKVNKTVIVKRGKKMAIGGSITEITHAETRKIPDTSRSRSQSGAPSSTSKSESGPSSPSSRSESS